MEMGGTCSTHGRYEIIYLYSTVGKTVGRKSFVISRDRWKDNIKTRFKEKKFEDVD